MRSPSQRRSWIATRALCWRRTNNMGIKGSPYSPPSPCGMSWETPISSSHMYVDGEHLTKGRTLSPSSIIKSPCNIAFLEIRSYTPIPSNTMVALSSRSVRVCKMWATHSHPALVENAYWKGAVAASAFLDTCLAIVLATNLSSKRRPRRSP